MDMAAAMVVMVAIMRMAIMRMATLRPAILRPAMGVIMGARLIPGMMVMVAHAPTLAARITFGNPHKILF